MSVCIIDTKNNRLSYSGAYNYAYLISNYNIQVLHGTRQTVGANLKELPFTCHKADFSQGDTLYLFTDGYAAQQNQDKEKYKASRFKSLLLNSCKISPTEQKRLIEEQLIVWQKNSPQIDDILVVGIQL